MNHDDEPAVTGISDAALLAALRRAVATVDGPPASVVAAARAAFLARDLGGEPAVPAGDRIRAGPAVPVPRAG